MSKIYAPSLAVALALTFSGCGSSGSSGSSAPVSVQLNQASATMNVNTTTQFTATVQNTSNTAVTWTVDAISGGNSTVGVITAAGLYTAPSLAGSHTVMATSVADTSKSASAAVTVNATASVSPGTADVAVSSTQQFTATVAGYSNTSVTWSVDGVSGGNSSVGTVNASGLYTAPSQAGNHNVTATSVANTALSANGSATVFNLTVSPGPTTVMPTATQQYTANLQGVSGGTISWSVDGIAGGNSTTGTISSSGLYTAPNATGSHTIAATPSLYPALTATTPLTVINGAPAAILTYHNDDARDGAFTQETTLTTANVNSTQFGKLASYPVDGQIYAQPLYLPQVSIAGSTHAVVYTVTQNNSVYAFDATGVQTTPFWHINLGTHVTKDDVSGVNPYVGILSTPVIDATTNTIYLVAEISGSGDPTPFFLHALDVATGAEKFGGPINITGTVNGTEGTGSSHAITLGTDCYQRMGLALNPVTNAIYIPFGSCVHGWVISYNKTTLKQVAVFNDTPNDNGGGGLWASGGAIAIDDITGDLYLMSGVDEGDQITTGYSDSFLRLDPNSLAPLDYFTPDNALLLEQNDVDLGSGSNILVPNNSSSTPHETIGGGKDGNIFVVNRDQMGSFSPNQNNVIQTVHTGTQQYNNIFSTPAYWNGSIYYHSSDDVLRAFSWDSSTGLMSTSSTSAADRVYSQHGATPSLSADDTMNGIIWDTDNSNYNENDPSASGPLVLHAYDASNVATELYNSSQNSSRDTAGLALKFTVPTISGGRVFVPTASALDIYGILPQ